MIQIKDISRANIDDLFKVCSRGKLNDPIQIEGINIKKKWMFSMIEKHGHFSKIAYYNGEPSAQVLFYPENVLPYINNPRDMVLLIDCIYNSNPRILF